MPLWSQVFDQYLNFISLEDDMFCLQHKNSEAISYYGKNNDLCAADSVKCFSDKLMSNILLTELMLIMFVLLSWSCHLAYQQFGPFYVLY